MYPRRPTSQKWTDFPKEFSAQIESVFKESFAQQLGDSELIVQGRIYAEEILLRVGVLEKGRIAQSNFEVSIDYDSNDSQVLDRIHHLVDVAASMMMEHYETQGEVEFPLSWKEFPFKGQPIYLQYSTENSDLEAQANAILGVSEDGFYHDPGNSDDALDRAEKRDSLH